MPNILQLMSFRGSHAMAQQFLEYCHDIHVCDVQ